MDADAPEHRARLHFIGHADPVKPLLTVAENLASPLPWLGGAAGPLDAALAGFDLAAGARRRLASCPPARSAATNLARLLASPRPLWLLDEPGVGLDAANRTGSRSASPPIGSGRHLHPGHPRRRRGARRLILDFGG